MTRMEAVNWLINIMSDIGKSQHRELWHYEQALAEIRELLEEQSQWIPCSERLPEEDEDVLVCSEDGDIDIAYWMPEQWTDEPHIEWWSGEYRVDAVAWMPLPEPYGGESE